MLKEDCIFCKIIKGEIPCFKIYENQYVLAFMDINPVTTGHTLIIPKRHYENIHDIDEHYLSEIINASKLISTKYKILLNADGFNILQANGKAGQQSVFHYHLHIVPRFNNDNIDLWFHGKKDCDIKSVYEKIKKDWN